MKVLFDDRGFRMVHGGVAKYFTELFLNFSPEVKAELGFGGTENYHLQQPPFSVPPYEHVFDEFLKGVLHGWKFRGAGHLYFWLNRILPRVVRYGPTDNDLEFCRILGERDYDLVHLTAPHEYGSTWRAIPRDKPFVVTIHDLIPELIFQDRKLLKLRREVLNRSQRIIAVSKFTKKKLVEVHGISSDKIDVIYHGRLEHGYAAPVANLVNKRYVLYVGKRNGYKNFDFFIRAIAPILSESQDLKLVCTGDKFDLSECKLFDSLGISDSVIHHFVTDSELTWLYQNAQVFVYPSQMEGFGIPILDALSVGCPVLLSRASCFPEIAQDAALYFELGDAADFRRQLMPLLADSELCNALRRKGYARVKDFSWKKCAQETEEVYLKCLSC